MCGPAAWSLTALTRINRPIRSFSHACCTIIGAEAPWNIGSEWQHLITAQNESLDVVPLYLFGLFHF